MRLWKDLETRDLAFAVAGGLLAWSIVGGLYVYVFEPQWRHREERISAEVETTEVTYIAGHTWDDEIQRTRCPSFNEIKKVWGETVEFHFKKLRLAFPEDLPWPEEVDLAVGGNRFIITGYRYEIFEENLLTGARREISYPDPRFDVVAWQVKMPYSQYSSSALNEDRQELEGRTDPVSHRAAAATLPPEAFHEFDDPASGPCRPGGLVRLPF